MGASEFGRRVRLHNLYEVLALGTNSLKSMTMMGTFLKALEVSAHTWYTLGLELGNVQ
jgi:hypothetical protein